MRRQVVVSLLWLWFVACVAVSTGGLMWAMR